jgi:NADP-dependent aldehyde dehydrogenase
MTDTVSDIATLVDTVAGRAAAAAPAYAAVEPRKRAAALVAVADALAAASAELIAIAQEETGLAEARLAGELKRTCVQLRLFADVVVDGSYLDVRLDAADPGFALGPRPDLRRTLVPVGPVVNFAASNFPFAFSVAGGDTAAALAAGCPVILKGHSGHPHLSERTAAVVIDALAASGMPDGTFQFIQGQDAGVAILKDERVRAGSFTGSLFAGRLLFDIAASRPRPIPFYGELGSVNPAFVTAAALEARADEIVDGFMTSIAGSAGQLCTKPGFLFVPAGHGLAPAIAERAAATPEHRLLHRGISRSYAERRDTVLAAENVTVIAEGSYRADDNGLGWVTPTIVSVSAATLSAQRDELLDEVFGPFSILVEYDAEDSLAELARELFTGNLTGTVQHAAAEDSPALRELVAELAELSGRVLFNGWPTGVAVSPAMQHGGPWPATTSEGTSVGTAAIGRFLRGVSYQNAPQHLLPDAVKDANPLGVPRSLAPAGESVRWGESAL